MNFLSIKPLTMNKYALPGYRQTLSLVTWKKKTLCFLNYFDRFLSNISSQNGFHYIYSLKDFH